DEVGDNAGLQQFARTALPIHRNRLVGLIVAFAARYEVTVPHPLSHRRAWEVFDRYAHVAARIPILQSSGEDRFQRGTRNYSKLALLRNRLCEPPTGNSRTHTALYDDWKIAHDISVSGCAQVDCHSFVLFTVLDTKGHVPPHPEIRVRRLLPWICGRGRDRPLWAFNRLPIITKIEEAPEPNVPVPFLGEGIFLLHSSVPPRLCGERFTRTPRPPDPPSRHHPVPH